VREHRIDPKYRRKQMEWNNKWRIKIENREKILAIRRKSQRKIAKALKIAGFITKEKRKEIYTRDEFKCLACGSDTFLTIDHINPIQKGGKTVDDNLQTLCRSCNSKKQNKMIDYRFIPVSIANTPSL